MAHILQGVAHDGSVGEIPSLEAQMNNTIDPTPLLSQLKSYAAEARAPELLPSEAGQAESESFSQLLAQSIDQVNQLQQEASGLKQAFELGDPNVSLAQAMIASNKAGLAFQGMVQVRNKLVEAYQEVMRMQV